MAQAGCAIGRIDRYDDWLSRFETAMNGLPEEQRHQSLLAILGPYRHPQLVAGKSMLQMERFAAAAKAAGFEIPPLSAALIQKYVADLRSLRLL
jgi:fatty acid CoA ligase FadD9